MFTSTIPDATAPQTPLTLYAGPALAHFHAAEVRLQACHLPVAEGVERVHGE